MMESVTARSLATSVRSELPPSAPAIPVVCRVCSRAMHVPAPTLRAGASFACGHCGAVNDLAPLMKGIPSDFVVEAPHAPRKVSEFP